MAKSLRLDEIESSFNGIGLDSTAKREAVKAFFTNRFPKKTFTIEDLEKQYFIDNMHTETKINHAPLEALVERLKKRLE
jgi:hypothetical protein